MSLWVTVMPYQFDWSDYVRYGSVRNNYCDSGGCVVRASRVKRISQRFKTLVLLQSSAFHAPHKANFALTSSMDKEKNSE